jgi:hypothetical protein
VARAPFTLGNASVKAGETFFLVKSVRREGRYYVVHFSEERCAWQCSCGANCTKHEHIKVAQAYVVEHVVKPRVAAILVAKEDLDSFNDWQNELNEHSESDGLGNSKEAWQAREKRAKAMKQEYAVQFNAKLDAIKQQQSEVA